MNWIIQTVVSVVRDLGLDTGMRWLIKTICRAVKHRKLKSKKCKNKTRKTKWKFGSPISESSNTSHSKRKLKRGKRKSEDYQPWYDQTEKDGARSSSESSSSVEKPRVVLTKITQRNTSDRNRPNLGESKFAAHSTQTEQISTTNNQETKATQVVSNQMNYYSRLETNAVTNEEESQEESARDVSSNPREYTSSEILSEATTARASSQEIREQPNIKNYYDSYIN